MQEPRLFRRMFSGNSMWRALIPMLLLFFGSSALAQSEDPPSRVGRLSESNGPVFVAPDDPGADWQPIGLNYPIAVGDNVWSGPDGRAEIDFGAGRVRLSRDTNIHFSQLDDRQFSAYLASGSAILRLRALDRGETAKFDTANVQVDLLRPGSYRIETDQDGLTSVVIVRDGEAQLRTVDGEVIVVSGQTATINGNGPGSAIIVREGYGTDGFDAWSADRDRRHEGGSLSTQYISGEVPGVRDLDTYGTWQQVPTYGAVWYPTTVATDWVPYSDGSWTFVQPWGWTWVDAAPWGWAPFHYGRWVHIGPRWAWCPGEYVRHPVYAPALVAWYGGPSGLSWSSGFASRPTFGWVPLAWGEPYWPHYRHTENYWRVINRPYAVNVTRVPPRPVQSYPYSNARIPGAVSAVSGDLFTGRHRITGNRTVVPAGALTGTAITTAPLAVRPVTRPVAVDSRPRGAPAPAGTFIGRGPLTRPELRAPADGRAITGHPGTVNESAPTGRQAYTPTVGGGRTATPEPGSGYSRPGAGSPPNVRLPGNEGRSETMRPITRDSAPATSLPMQAPRQIYAPTLRSTPPVRATLPEPAQIQQRPMPRELAPQSVPRAPQPQSLAPAPQYMPAPQRAPPPQHVTAPQMPTPAPVIREALPVNPAPVPIPIPIPTPGQPPSRTVHPNAQNAAPAIQVPSPGSPFGPVTR